MTVEQIVKIKGITECTLELFEYGENEAMMAYSTYTLTMNDQEKNATVYKLEETYRGFDVVNYKIKAYVG